MSISQIYKQKSESLNMMLQDNTLNNNQKGEQLFSLINRSWDDYYNHALAPFHLPELTSPNGLFTQNANLYGNFFREIEHLLNEQLQQPLEQRMNTFLAWFVSDIQQPQHQIDGFFGFVNGVYLATFFLMLKFPEKYLVNLRKPMNQVANHPLVITGIIDAEMLAGMIISNQQLFNFGTYNRLNNHIIMQRGVTNFIDFMGILEDEYQQAQDKKTDK